MKNAFLLLSTEPSEKILYKKIGNPTTNQISRAPNKKTLAIDNKFILNRFLSYWKPAALLLCESEIWPNLICATKNRKIKLILINARITKKSFKRWRLLKHFSKKKLNLEKMF